MTISSENRLAGPYIGNGTAASFQFDFKVFAPADLLVVMGTPAGVEVDLTLVSDYAVVLNPNQDAAPGGSITLPAALATGYRLVITSDLQALQKTLLTNQGGFYPTVINAALDKLTILVQQMAGDVRRSIKFPISDGPIPSTLPVAAKRARKALVFGADGRPGVSVDDYDDQLANVTAQAQIATAAAQTATTAATSAAVSAEVAAAAADLAQTANPLAPINVNAAHVTNNFTLRAGWNGESVGPMTIDPGTTVAVEPGTRWIIL